MASDDVCDCGGGLHSGCAAPKFTKQQLDAAVKAAVADEQREMIAWFEHPDRRMTLTANEIRDCIRRRAEGESNQ
jgi:hypothetical protein